MNKHILIVCWGFPPNEGIGGRRWAKFAKALVSKGYKLHVIKSSIPKLNKISHWHKDVDDKNIVTYNLEPYWAVNWLHDYDSKLSFFKIRIAKYFLKYRFNGTIFDKAIGVKDEFLKLANQIITRNNIKNVVVTGAPFNLMYFGAKLKEGNENINLIVDYRDPWINSVNYGIRDLSVAKRNEEMRKQKKVFKYANVITAPNSFLINQIKETNESKEVINSKFVELSHFFDRDDFVEREVLTDKAPEKFRLLYAGALYTDSELYLTQFAKSINKFKKQFPLVGLEIDFYTSHRSESLNELMHSGEIKFHKPIGDEIFNKIREYDLLIILLADHNKDFKTTKYFEFMPYRVPYLFVGPKGYVSESIEKEKIGIVLREESDLIKAYNDRLKNTESVKLSNIDDFSLNAISHDLEKLFVF